jgi:hypothetical protein
MDKNIPPGKIKEIELIYDRSLMLCLTYDDGIQPETNHHVFTASIDLGEIHAISSVSENNEGIMITGRKLRSMKRLRKKWINVKRVHDNGRSTIVQNDLFYRKPRPNQLMPFIRLAGL